MRSIFVILLSAVLIHSVIPGPPPTNNNCLLTTHGCCEDGTTTAIDEDKSNCEYRPLLGGCAGTQFGCCKDGTYANDLEMSNCGEGETGLIGGCHGTEFGCCKDGTYAKDLQKSNCPKHLLLGNGLELLDQNYSNTNDTNTTKPSQQPFHDNPEPILTILGTTTFLFVLLFVALLIISAFVIIVYRFAKRRRVKKLRMYLECEEVDGVEMGDPLMVEEFGVSIPNVNT